MASNGCPNQGFPQYQIKVNATEKSKLIEAEMALYDNKIEMIDDKLKTKIITQFAARLKSLENFLK
jgi:hypothetical protein